MSILNHSCVILTLFLCPDRHAVSFLNGAMRLSVTLCMAGIVRRPGECYSGMRNLRIHATKRVSPFRALLAVAIILLLAAFAMELEGYWNAFTGSSAGGCGNDADTLCDLERNLLVTEIPVDHSPLVAGDILPTHCERKQVFIFSTSSVELVAEFHHGSYIPLTTSLRAPPPCA